MDLYRRIEAINKRMGKWMSNENDGVLFIDNIPLYDTDPIEHRDRMENESIQDYMEYLDSIGLEYFYARG